MNRAIEKKEWQQERTEKEERREKNEQTGYRSLWLDLRGEQPFLADQRTLRLEYFSDNSANITLSLGKSLI